MTPSLPEPGALTPLDVAIAHPDGRVLRAWRWQREAPRALVILVHGLGEHSGLYRSFAEWLAHALDVDVLAIDLRGHGRSFGPRGLVYSYDEFLDDLSLVLDRVARDWPDLPRYVLGHSNGGLVTLATLLRDPSLVDGLILSNPALGLKYDPPRHKVLFGRVLDVLAPRVTLGGPLPVDGLTRDPLQQVSLRNDRLMHTRISARLFFGMLANGKRAAERAGELSIPLLMLLGGEDPIIDPAINRRYYDAYGGADKTLVMPPELRHSLLVELGREQIFAAIAEWLDARLAGEAGPSRVTPTPHRTGRSARR